MLAELDFKDLPLIQAIRATQAVMEAGVTVSIKPSHVKIYDYLKKWFKVDYTTSDAPLMDTALSHVVPFIRIGNETRILLYPYSVIRKCRKLWANKRKGILFIGLIPDHRKAAMRKWRNIAEIEATNKGRKGVERYWDQQYYERMAKAEFVLCPDGGHPWTYRFFEAILCGATPIVERDLPCYEGFYYHKWNDLKFKRKKVEENYQLAVQRLTIEPELLRQNLYKKV